MAPHSAGVGLGLPDGGSDEACRLSCRRRRAGVELGASLLVLLQRLVWLAAGGLAVLTVVASWVAEPFWTMQGHARIVAMNAMLEHLGLVAAFAMLTWIVMTRIPVAHQSAKESPWEDPS
jgi:uncharacterized membrane protein YphA (DoxX/SURF4 family)